MERLYHGHLHPLVERLENRRLDVIVSQPEADALTKELPVTSQLKIG
jgi:hypothetical protein